MEEEEVKQILLQCMNLMKALPSSFKVSLIFNYLLELADDVKDLKKNVENLKNNQNNYEKDLDSKLKNSIKEVTSKAEKETKEQKEYITSLHQDIEESIKK